MSEMAAAKVWDIRDQVCEWPCDFSDFEQPAEHFEFVPVELRKQVRLFCVHLCWPELNPAPLQQVQKSILARVRPRVSNWLLAIIM